MCSLFSRSLSRCLSSWAFFSLSSSLAFSRAAAVWPRSIRCLGACVAVNKYFVSRRSIFASRVVMDKIEDIRVTELKNSAYIKPTRLLFKQNGKERIWDLMKSHDSVAAVIHNKTRDVLVFVRQFRPAVYYGRIPAHELASGAPLTRANIQATWVLHLSCVRAS
uniref:Putative conserved secreted protein n=1 Tax=Amblyomma cajennense TaxID=34607 RepID=A0A023FC26_AMBCJ